MSNELSFEQAMKLYEKGIFNCGKNIIKLSKGKNLRTEYFIHKIKIDQENKILKFKIIDKDSDMRIADNYKWVSYKDISNISDMSINKVLEAYDMSGKSSVEEIDIETDVETDVIGKSNACIDGIELEEGQRFIFLNNKNTKYNNRIYTVKFIDDAIKLVANRGRPKKVLN